MQRALKVREITTFISNLLTLEPVLHQVSVEGEIANLRQGRYSYFDLQDDQAVLHCACFRPLPLACKNGDQVVATGNIKVYPKGGRYQLVIDDLQATGLGAKLLALEKLKRQLEREGLFDPQRKRQLPPFVQRVGLITSLQGAVLHDFANECNRRYPLVSILVAPALVQGDQAAGTIIQALQALVQESARQPLDAIVIARGGGSQGDLDCFNDEGLVRAVAASPIPIVSAIGHQVDNSLMDLAADLRASTPTEAAILILPDQLALHQQIDEGALRAQNAILSQIRQKRIRLQEEEAKLTRLSPLAQLYQLRARLDRSQQGMDRVMTSGLQERSKRLNHLDLARDAKLQQTMTRRRKQLDARFQSIRDHYEERAAALTWRVRDEGGQLVSQPGSLKEGKRYRLEAAAWQYGIEVLDKEERDGRDSQL